MNDNSTKLTKQLLCASVPTTFWLAIILLAIASDSFMSVCHIRISDQNINDCIAGSAVIITTTTRGNSHA